MFVCSQGGVVAYPLITDISLATDDPGTWEQTPPWEQTPTLGTVTPTLGTVTPTLGTDTPEEPQKLASRILLECFLVQGCF